MSITDELRKVAAKTECANGRCEKLYRGDLEHIADRIDASVASEYVELPKDADGETIHVGDTVYGCRSGMKMTISELRMTADGWSISTSRGYLTDAEVTHACPDSWERIAYDIETVVPIDDEGDERLRHELADRIRRLAKKEDNQ